MYNNNLNNHWSIYPRSFNILIHIPRIIHQQSPPFFFTFTRYIRVQRSFVTRWSAGQLEGSIKTGTIERPTAVFCIGLLHTQCPHRAGKRISLSPSLSFCRRCTKSAQFACAKCVPSDVFLSFFFFFQINFNPRRGERPIVTLTRFLPRKRGLLRRGVWRKESGTFLFDSLCMVFDLVCSPRWGGMFIRKKESVFFEEGWNCVIFYENGGVHLVDFNDSAPGLK